MKEDTNKEVYQVSKEIIDNLKLIPGNNKVLVRTFIRNEDKETDAGILTNPIIYDQNRGQHANRVYEVIKAPKELRFVKGDKEKNYVESIHKKNGFTPPDWDTDVEIKDGDIVISTKRAAFGVTYQCEDKEYKFLNYSDLYVALRPARKRNWKDKGRKRFLFDDELIVDEIIPLNGYLICEDIIEKNKSDILWTPDEDRIKYGKVAYCGKPNKQYYSDVYSDCAEVDVGDVVMKKKSRIHKDLEGEIHKFFYKDKDLFVMQRRDILCKLNEVKTLKKNKKLKIDS